MNRAKRIPPLAASNFLWGGQGAGNMPRRHDLLERLTPDNPNYAIGRKFYLEAWADSHFLVAEAHAGRVSFSDFVDGCAQTFSQAAQTHVAVKDETPIPARCRAVDYLARKFIRQFAKTMALESSWLGEAQVAAGIDAFSRRVNEIAARSKQQILEAALAEQSGESLDTPQQAAQTISGELQAEKLAQTISHSQSNQNQQERLMNVARPVAQLQTLKFALRRSFQDGQTTPLKSWEAVREELVLLAGDGRTPPDLRTKISDELNPQDEALRDMLDSAIAEVRRDGGRIIIDRILEPAEATQFRKSPEYRDRVVAEHYRNLTARAFDDLESEDAVFFSGVLNAAQRATAIKLNARLDRSLLREEQHDLLRRFSADHLGVSGPELASALQGIEWRDRCLAWLIRHVKMRVTRGAPKNAAAEMTRAHWEQFGRPQLTAEVCDRLAKLSYPAEFATAKLYSKKRKRLRDRVGKQVRAIISKTRATTAAT